jgi:hypothetical protein
MVEARVYDQAGTLIESRLAYAASSLTPAIHQAAQRDIDALLTSDPASSGTVLPAGEIPLPLPSTGNTPKKESPSS